VTQNLFSKRAEVSVIGAVLLSGATAYAACDLQADDFYVQEHRHIWGAFVDMHAAGVSPCTTTTHDTLMRKGKLEAAGGFKALVKLSQAVPTASNASHYAEIIKRHSIARRAAITAKRLQHNLKADPLKAIEETTGALSSLAASLDKRRAVDLAAVVLQAHASLHKKLKASGGEGFAHFGLIADLPDLDAITGGFVKGDMAIIAGRPGMGKTCLGLHLALAQARKGAHVLICSLEMGREQLGARLLCAHSAYLARDVETLDTKELARGRFANKERALAQLEKGAFALASIKGKVTIEDNSGTTPQSLARLAAAIQSTGRLDMIVVDYVQLMHAGKFESRRVEVDFISAELRRLAGALNVSMICLAQLNRGVEARVDKRPLLSDLRESGSLESDASTVCFLYRESYYDKERARTVDPVEVCVAKNRHGETGIARVGFVPKQSRFLPFAP
tara:strand:+ start:764 stop:2107 length:1344 start_codon:yes stop_codon:yes gene_type:complete